MAKIKNKKRKTADHIHKKNESKKVMNPFEIHVNKEKMRVLGKKQKNDRGIPGISRAKAIEKRKHTLLQEYKVLNKSNKFTDRRIGEKNWGMTEEDKVMARYTAVRIKSHNKKSIFNLADDEVLTHRGQTLSEIEKFDDPRSDDDEDERDEKTGGNLDRQFVQDAHFGGGLFKNTGKEGAKTHKELIDQLIAESKKRKAEKQQSKEATMELTEKLDTEWKDLLPIVNKSKKTDNDEIDDKPKVDDYDKVMRELKFEARGTVTDRLKTEDEVAKEEKQKLEDLEKERLDRMMGISEDKPKHPTHRSADDLDDDFVYESDPEYMLSYSQEGESNIEVNAEINGKRLDAGKVSGEEDENDNQESDNDDEEKEEDAEEEEESEDNLSDLKEESSESEEELEKKIISKSVTTKRKLKETSPVSKAEEPVKTKRKSEEIRENEELEEISSKPEKTKKKLQEISQPKEKKLQSEDLQADIMKDLQKRKQMMEKAREELPFTFSLPDSYESLQKTLEHQSSNHQAVIVERMMKCNHPSLAEANKENLGTLFAFMLQYINDLGTEAIDEASVINCFEIFVALVPQIYELAKLNEFNAHKSMKEVIKEKYDEYKKNRKAYPGLELLLFLKLASILFSTSDFRHQVISSCFMFIEQMLTKCRVRTRQDISYGLFLCTMFLEYTTLSKRYLPAVITFLLGVVHMAIPKSSVRLLKILPPFKSTSSLLVLLNGNTKLSKNVKMEKTDLLDFEIDENFKIRTFYTAIQLLKEFSQNFKEFPSNVEIFETVLKYLEMIPVKNYPKFVQVNYNDLLEDLKTRKSERKLEFILMEAEKPKALRLYEPKIVEVYDGKRFKVQSKAKAERDKLMHKLKKEKKGAIREIRRDKAFLGRVKLHQKIQSDKERKEKVKRIYAEASIQQSELNAIDRKKKRK